MGDILQVTFVKMSTIPKHFGLTAREESYMFKELEKVRQETKKECYQFKRKLAARLPLRASGPEDAFEDEDGEARPCSATGSSGTQRPASSLVAKPSSPPPPPSKVQSPERPGKADLQGAPQSTRRRGPGKPEPFRPRDFYLRSSAFLRHQAPRAPPAIARQAGTAMPARLLRPRSRHKRRHVKIQGEQVAKRVFPMSPAHEAPGIEAARPRYRQASSLSSLSSETDESGRLRRLRIRTHFLREGMGSVRWFRPLSRAGREMTSGQASLQMTRAFPTNIEEIVASLQSEAQMASDQTIKELIQSILGQNYDLTKEVGELTRLVLLGVRTPGYTCTERTRVHTFPALGAVLGGISCLVGILSPPLLGDSIYVPFRHLYITGSFCRRRFPYGFSNGHSVSCSFSYCLLLCSLPSASLYNLPILGFFLSLHNTIFYPTRSSFPCT